MRHDNLLYAKQSHSGGAACSYPATYVEPIPQLYEVLGGFARRASKAFAVVPAGSMPDSDVGAFFARVAGR